MVNGVLVSPPLIGFSIKFYDFLLGRLFVVLRVIFSTACYFRGGVKVQEWIKNFKSRSFPNFICEILHYMFKSPYVWCPVFITGTKIYFFRSMLQSVSISTFRLIKRGSCVGTVCSA
jgi:hypothetical protein